MLADTEFEAGLDVEMVAVTIYIPSNPKWAVTMNGEAVELDVNSKFVFNVEKGTNIQSSDYSTVLSVGDITFVLTTSESGTSCAWAWPNTTVVNSWSGNGGSYIIESDCQITGVCLDSFGDEDW